MKWVQGSSQWYKHYSLWGILLLGVLPFLEEHVYTVSSVLPPGAQPYVNLGLAIVVAVLRFIRQSSIQREDNDA